MNIHGHGFQDHLHLVAPLYGLIGAVWALRMILAAAGAYHGMVVAVSVTVATAFSVLVAVMLIHVRRFGSYSNVVFVCFLLSLWGQLLISAAIGFSALTGKATVYAAPEFSVHTLTYTQHIVGHLTFGVGFGTISGTAMGWLLLWMLRQLPGETSRQNR